MRYIYRNIMSEKVFFQIECSVITSDNRVHFLDFIKHILTSKNKYCLVNIFI